MTDRVIMHLIIPGANDKLTFSLPKSMTVKKACILMAGLIHEEWPDMDLPQDMHCGLMEVESGKTLKHGISLALAGAISGDTYVLV